MRNLIKGLGVILAITAWMQLSQPAMAQTNVRHYTVHIAATAGTTVVTASNAYISSCIVTVSTVGTNPIQITNTAGEVKLQYASTALGTILPVVETGKTDSLLLVGIKIVAPATAVFDVTMVYYL